MLSNIIANIPTTTRNHTTFLTPKMGKSPVFLSRFYFRTNRAFLILCIGSWAEMSSLPRLHLLTKHCQLMSALICSVANGLDARHFPILPSTNHNWDQEVLIMLEKV